jgi:hypothetical protein
LYLSGISWWGGVASQVVRKELRCQVYIPTRSQMKDCPSTFPNGSLKLSYELVPHQDCLQEEAVTLVPFWV